MNDLISKMTAIKAFAGKPPEYYSTGYICDVLNELPAVDAAPMIHGRWVYEHDDPAMIPCSVCGYQVFRYNNTRYCPNCGAKMDSERRNSE